MAPEPDKNVNGPLVWSALCIAITVIVVLALVPPVVRAAIGPSLEGDRVGDRVAKLMAQHDDAARTYRERFDGRSAFFKPPQPRREPERVVERKPEPEPEPEPQERPRERRKPPYGGPAIKGFFGDEVFFTGNLRVRVGEEIDGVRVVSVDLPRSARIFYDEWEHEVEFLEPVPEDFFGVADARRDGDLPGLIDATVEPEDHADGEDEGASSDGERAEPRGGGVGGRRSGRDVATPVNDSGKNGND